ncbi:MAG: TonB-dependent receptor [Thermodesulfobacteriota bacterium]|nr:TonB-dependent receptor [Thermodesulfobacteriota bacterium]
MKKRGLLIILFIVIMKPLWSWGAGDKKKTEKVDDIVVTATKSEQSKDEIPSVVDVISSVDLEVTNERDLTGVLKKNSSVDVIEYPGALSGISIRGFRPEYKGITKHTLILIDGKPSGATNLATILKDNVERIEVLKGPSSSLYGAESMGGVVNVITKKSKGKLTSSLTGGYGSFDRYYSNFFSGGNLHDKFDFDIALSKEGRDDFSQGSKDIETSAIPQNNLDDDTRENTKTDERSINVRIGSYLTDDLRLDFTVSNYYGEIETPGGIYKVPPQPSDKELENYRYDLSLGYEIKNHDFSFSLYSSSEDNYYIKKPSGEPSYKSSLSTTEWVGCQLNDTLHYNKHDITFGVDYQKIDQDGEGFNSDGSRKAPSKPNNSRTNMGAFTDSFMKLMNECLIVNVGMRFDNFELKMKDTPYITNEYSTESQDFEVFSPRLGVKYFFPKSRIFQFHSTIGTAFVPPTAYQIAGDYEYYGDIIQGNEDIDPEKSVTWDAGLTIKQIEKGYSVDLTYFNSDVEDKIVEYLKDEVANIRSFKNSDEAKIRGIEWELSYDFGVLMGLQSVIELYCNCTCLIESEEYNEGEWKDIQNVSDTKYNVGILYHDNRFFGRFSLRHIGKMKDTDWDDINNDGEKKGDVISYGNFDILDFSAGISFLKHHKISISIDNILDTYYYEKGGYPLDGRTYYAQYTFKF